MKEYVAPNGEILIATNDVQEAAFIQAGLKPAEEQKRSRTKPE